MTWRPKGYKNPYPDCDNPDCACPQREVDGYGLVCAVWCRRCGLHNIWENAQDAMYNAMIKHLESQRLKFFDCMYHHGNIKQLLKNCFKEE